MTIIKRIQSALSRQALASADKALSGALPPDLGYFASSSLRSLAAGGGINTSAAIGIAQSRLLSRVPDRVRAEVERASSNFANQMRGIQALAGARNITTLTPDQATAAYTGPSLRAYPAAPLFGGLSVDRAIKIFSEAANLQRAMKSLWHIGIVERETTANGAAGMSRLLNLLAIDANFGPVTIDSSPANVGSGVIDVLTGTQRVELALTTYDDEQGTVRRWFAGKCDQVAREDGTFGLPAQYGILVTITEMDVLGESTPENRLMHRWWMRPVSFEQDLSRRQHEHTEVQLRFAQLDTFVKAT